MKKNSDKIIKEGSPWKLIGRFPTYNEAAKKVDEDRTPDSKYDYKIKRYENDYRVKKRLRADLLKNKKNQEKCES
jgi:chitodextrinase|tara:strand:- start:341 stop:565 length:225 start_codon:yes stop_codon:yes gene_type:complete